MAYLQMFLMGVLSVCGIGVFALLVFVFSYIFKEIYFADKRANICDWRKIQDTDCYSTGCNNEFYDATESGNPPTDWMTYCPYCSGKVDIK